VLIGDKTKYLRKFVKWEMEVALRLGLPIIGVNLDGSKLQTELCPATIKNELVIYVPFQAKIIEYAMENWPTSHRTHVQQNVSGPRFYKDHVYAGL